MLVFSMRDLENLLGENQLRVLFEKLTEPGEEIILFTCPHDSLYFGHVYVPITKRIDYERFVPSSSYASIYLELPETRIAPCPLCGSPVSTIRVELGEDSLKVYSG